MKSKKYLLLTLIIIGSIFYFQSGVTYVPAEELSILSTIGMDVTVDQDGNKTYSVPIALYNFNTSPKITSFVLTGKGDTLGETRESRQLKLDKKLLLGLEKIVLSSEETAKYGVEPWLDILFANPNVNDTGYFVVCKGKTEDMMNLKINGYPSSGDYIEGIVRHSTEQSFFPKKYELMDIYDFLVGEGKNISAPYIEVVDNLPMITGLALFDKDKMVRKIDLKESKAMNLLRNSNVRGTITIEDSSHKYVDVYVTSKRKVRVSREGDKYTFNIDINADGYIMSNLIYENPYQNPEILKNIGSGVEREVREITEDFVRKMQSEYKVDCLNLGSYAAAKFGRRTGTNWNEVVSNADININVKAKIDIRNRGQLK